MRLISKEEKDRLNSLIRPALGWRFEIENGTVLENADGNDYHFGIFDTNAANLENLKFIAKTIKETFGNVKNVYSGGKLII